MRDKGSGLVFAQRRKKFGKTLLVPTALAVTTLSAACGNDEQKTTELASCDAVADAATCQVCRTYAGTTRCNGLPLCVFDPDGGVCREVA